MAVKFEIYRDGRRTTAFTPMGASAMGPESVPVPAEVAWHNGLLSVNRRDDQPVGVSLLWEVGEVGAFQLETTRLRHRERPYNLNVELARFRLMKIVQKQEDWNLFDFPGAEPFQQQFREAQSWLSEALGKLDAPAEAAQLADRSLAASVELSERLANFHGDLLIKRRRQMSQFVRRIFGCRVDSGVANPKYRQMLAESFDYAVVPISWKRMQPQEHVFITDEVDEWMELLAAKRVPIIAGPLIHLIESQVPDWMFIWEHDFDTLRDLTYEFVVKVAQRYRRAVAVWNVSAGLSDGALFPMSFEQTIELTRLLVAQVKSVLPAARTLVTITHPFGEYNARGAGGVPPLLYAEMVAQAGINFEGFGLELELGVPRPGMFMRDLFQISCLLDKFSTLNKPLFLTAVNVPGRWTADAGDWSEGEWDPSKAGRWHGPWDPQLQAQWMEAVYRLALSKPYVESIAWGNLADIHPSLPAGGLVDDLFQPKPGFARLQEMREKFHRWGKKQAGG